MSFKLANIESTGKILKWNGNSVAINKINSVDLTYSMRKFPISSLVCIAIGVVLMGISHWFFGLCLAALGGLYIYWWSKHRRFNYQVNLRTSSTEPFILNFGENAEFGDRVKNAILDDMAEL
ncbi:hypothetical protein LNP18_10090 [Leuconostoc citreum]|uniref:hypothetical protein n=1 Tax=Leuconostoc citreum TaxID=33964 RepID=UPI00200B7A9E|nr:hypothetical protein [Leuconostoc citreum]MCK8606447.1 hypothetical protein [Leuconostoc citreum]